MDKDLEIVRTRFQTPMRTRVWPLRAPLWNPARLGHHVLAGSVGRCVDFEASRGLAAAGRLTAHVAAPLVKPDDPNSFKATLALRAESANIPMFTIPG